jgi:protein-tyrosine phosphatase
MVCLGNICRSPLAEGILKKKAKNINLDIFIDSAGTGSWHSGSSPDPRSIEIARKNKIDITKQRARQFKSTDFNDFDKILVMDISNQTDLLRLASSKKDTDKIELILNYSNPNSRASVPDPYYEGENGFEKVFELLNIACDKLLEQIK